MYRKTKQILFLLFYLFAVSCDKKNNLKNYEEYFSEMSFWQKKVISELKFDYNSCIFFNGVIKTKKGSQNGTIIMDVKDKTNPKFVNNIQSFGYGLSCIDEKLYIPNWEKGIETYSIKRPYRYKKYFEYGGKWGEDKKLFFKDNYIYIFGQDGLDIVKVKGNKAERVKFLAGNWRTGGLASYQNYLYIASNTDYIYEVRIMDISDLENPKIINYLSYTASKLYVYGQTLFICTGTSIYIMDIKNPEIPEFVSIINEYANDVCFFENYVIIANEFKDNISFYDISEVRIPKKTSEINYIEKIDSIVLMENYLYIAQKNKGLSIYNIVATENPELILKKKGEFYNITTLKKSRYIY